MRDNYGGHRMASTVLAVSCNITVLSLLPLPDFCFFYSLGRTPKRKLSLSGDDPATPNAGFQRSLSTVSNESGKLNKLATTSIDSSYSE